VRVPELSVVLPCYNEQASVAVAVASYCRALKEAGLDDFELIVVDDASTDRTGDVAEAIARSEPRVRVLRHDRNRGQVVSILDGFKAARGRVLTHNGIDLPFHPEDSARALAMVRDGVDVVVVERSHRRAYSLARKAISLANVSLLKLLFGTPFADHNFVQFYRAEVIASVPVLSRGVSTVTPELILRALRAGFRVRSCEAEYHERREGRSTITTKKVLKTTWETFRLWRLMRPVVAEAARPAVIPHPKARQLGGRKREVQR
jgi:glycosyltransferase involved in cell wall biosynthesis